MESFDGRFYTVSVSATDVSAKDSTREIGSGTVGRAIVSVGKFMEKIKQQGGMG